jgi:hypothetical protein
MNQRHQEFYLALTKRVEADVLRVVGPINVTVWYEKFQPTIIREVVAFLSHDRYAAQRTLVIRMAGVSDASIIADIASTALMKIHELHGIP